MDNEPTMKCNFCDADIDQYGTYLVKNQKWYCLKCRGKLD